MLVARDFQSAFAIFQEDILASGVDGVLYTFIPQLLIDNKHSFQPVYRTSDGFNADHMIRAARERSEQQDLRVAEVTEETADCINWWEWICEAQNSVSQECMAVPLEAENISFTVLLMSDVRGIAGVNINYDSKKVPHELNKHLKAVKLKAQMSHCLVLSNPGFMTESIQPWAELFNSLHLDYVRGMIQGKKAYAIAEELGTSQGYLEQTLLRLRRKLSVVGKSGSPRVSRNQILYYAGMLHLLESR